MARFLKLYYSTTFYTPSNLLGILEMSIVCHDTLIASFTAVENMKLLLAASRNSQLLFDYYPILGFSVGMNKNRNFLRVFAKTKEIFGWQRNFCGFTRNESKEISKEQRLQRITLNRDFCFVETGE